MGSLFIKNYDLNIPDDQDDFMNQVDRYVLENNPLIAEEALLYFSDNVSYDWVLESVRCSLEHLNPIYLLQGLEQNYKYLFENAPNYFKSILKSFFMSPLFYKDLVIFLKENKNSLMWGMINLLEKESPHHAALIKELRKELSEK
jgi:hypothetical protein